MYRFIASVVVVLFALSTGFAEEFAGRITKFEDGKLTFLKGFGFKKGQNDEEQIFAVDAKCKFLKAKLARPRRRQGEPEEPGQCGVCPDHHDRRGRESQGDRDPRLPRVRGGQERAEVRGGFSTLVAQASRLCWTVTHRRDARATKMLKPPRSRCRTHPGVVPDKPTGRQPVGLCAFPPDTHAA